MAQPKSAEGSAGDVNYGTYGAGYANHRRPEPRIAAQIHAALGDARTVLNVGAGAGSYEPIDREVTAVEPSDAMRAQRPRHLVGAIDAVAEKLPFPNRSFDASMATFSVHQWTDFRAGLLEMRRVTRGPVVILSCDPDALASFWLERYAPDVIATEARRYPPVAAIRTLIGARARVEVTVVPIPLACADGFNEAYYGRPERLLDRRVRLACSAWSFLDDAAVARFENRLRRDLADGTWDAAYGVLRTLPQFEGSLRLMVGHADP